MGRRAITAGPRGPGPVGAVDSERRGVATAVGIFLVLAPIAVLCAGVIFIAIVALTRYVSLGSIIAAVLIPVFVWFLSGSQPLLTAAIVAAALIVFAHRGNIKRLASRTESRI